MDFRPFTYKTFEDLKNQISKLNLDIPYSMEKNIFKQNIISKNFIIPNRLSIQPMEGFDSKLDGSPSDLTFRRYQRYARGGVGLIWFEATAITKDSRSNSHQLMLTEQNKSEFKNLVERTREICNETLKSLGFYDKCVLILQLNHSGRYSTKNGEKFPIKAYDNEKFDKVMNVSSKDGKVISDDRLRELEDIWVEKSVLAKNIGFDGVDIKACHGYLISELLTARKRENSEYGGKTLEGRSKLLINIIEKISDKLRSKDDFIITSRLGIYDGLPFPYGFGTDSDKYAQFPAPRDLKEPLNLIHNLYQKGISLINISMGNPHYRPFLTRPYDISINKHKNPPEHPLISCHRILDGIASVKKQIPKDMTVIGSAYSYFRQFAGYIASGSVINDGIDICGFGRMSFANPDFAKQIFLDGKIDKTKVCITCSKCSALMKKGKNTGCVIRDPMYKDLI